MTVATSVIALAPVDRARTALRFDAQVISYGELDERIETAATALFRDGIRAGDTVAVLAENSPEILITYHAAARLGAVFVAINTNLAAAEVSYVVDHSETKLLLCDEATRPVASQVTEASRLRSVTMLSRAGGGSGYAKCGPVGDFMITYTSGTTGKPKAVVFDQANEVAGNAALAELWAITPEDRMVVALPLGFLYGLSTASATGLQTGCEVILLPRFHPAQVLEALTEQNATVFHGVPTMFAMMLDYCESNGLRFDLSHMRILVCAGAPLSAALKARFAERFGKEIDDYYALTEIRPVFGRAANDAARPPKGAIGKAAPGADIRIVDAAGTPVQTGDTGEILVRAASTLLRYHKDPVLTASSLRGGYFATGDVGYRDADGYYYLTGRIKDIIIRGGANISPVEVEDVLMRHEAVANVAVLGRADHIYGEVPIAVLVLKDGVSPDDPTIVEHCRSLLAAFKVPVAFHGLSELPLGPTGKVDKNKLRSILGLDR